MAPPPPAPVRDPVRAASRQSCLYVGEVMHRRPSPAHRFTYRVTSLLLDLDEVGRDLPRLLSRDRFNLFSVRNSDLGPGDGTDPAAWARALLARHGVTGADGPIRVHLFPRLLGWGFTPLSTWFCHRADGRLAAVLYDVHNTFGERHVYLARSDGPGTQFHTADKIFHVSPFIGLGGVYRFALRPPDARFSLVIREHAADGAPLMVASHHARRVALSDAALVRAACAMPLLPIRVLGGIHWEAWRLWRKGARVWRKPAPPSEPVSIARVSAPDTPLFHPETPVHRETLA